MRIRMYILKDLYGLEFRKNQSQTWKKRASCDAGLKKIKNSRLVWCQKQSLACVFEKLPPGRNQTNPRKTSKQCWKWEAFNFVKIDFTADAASLSLMEPQVSNSNKTHRNNSSWNPLIYSLENITLNITCNV